MQAHADKQLAQLSKLKIYGVYPRAVSYSLKSQSYDSLLNALLRLKKVDLQKLEVAPLFSLN